MSMELGPYTNFHELNQDWFLSEFNKVLKEWAEMKKSFNSLSDAFNDLKSYVQDYFKNLDVQDEINNKLDEMVNNGTFSELLNKYSLRSNEESVYPLSLIAFSFYLPSRNSLILYSNDGLNFDVMCEIPKAKSGNSCLWYNNDTGYWYKFDYSDADGTAKNGTLKVSTSKNLFDWTPHFYDIPVDYDSDFSNPGNVFKHNGKLYLSFNCEYPDATVLNPIGQGFKSYVIEINGFNNDNVIFGELIELNLPSNLAIIDPFINNGSNGLIIMFRADMEDGRIYWCNLNDDFTLNGNPKILEAFNVLDGGFEAPSFFYHNGEYYVYADNFTSSAINTPGGGLVGCKGSDLVSLSAITDINNSNYPIRACGIRPIHELDSNAVTSLITLKNKATNNLIVDAIKYTKINKRNNYTLLCKSDRNIIIINNNITIDEIENFELKNGDRVSIIVPSNNTVKIIRGGNILFPNYKIGYYITAQNCEKLISFYKTGDNTFLLEPFNDTKLFKITNNSNNIDVNVLHEGFYYLHVIGDSNITTESQNRVIDSMIYVFNNSIKVINNGDIVLTPKIKEKINNFEDVVNIVFPYEYSNITIECSNNSSIS